MKAIFIFLCSLLILAPDDALGEQSGKRILTLPAMVRALRLSKGGNLPAAMVLGAAMEYVLILTNISSITQSGTIELLRGSGVLASSGSAAANPPSDFYMCTNIAHSSASQTPSADWATNLPGAIGWSVAAGATEEIRVGVVSQGRVGVNSASIDLGVKPILKITVSETQGALLASFYSFIAEVSTGNGVFQLFNKKGPVTWCTGNAYNSNDSYDNIPVERATQLVQVNGGHAF